MKETIYGIHAIQSLLKHMPQNFLEVYLLKDCKNQRLQLIIKELKKTNVNILTMNRQWLNKKVKGAAHQGIIALIKVTKKYQESDLPILLNQQNTPLLLVLDGINDSHNLGACLRCADATGVDAVIIPHHRTVKLNGTVKKVASGAAETVPLIRVNNLARTLQFLKKQNIWIIGADEKSEHDIYQSKLTKPLALVMGAESNGIRHLTRKYCNEFISIPMLGNIFSLNISVAAGVCLFEIIRQRRIKQ